MGIYITGHPLDDFKDELMNATTSTIAKLTEGVDGSAVRVGGLIKTMKNHRSKKGDAMAFLTLEDTMASVEVVVFPQAYAKCSHLLSSDEPLVILGTLQKDDEGGDPKILAEEVDSLIAAQEKYTVSARIVLQVEQVNRQKVESLKTVIHKHHGNCPVSLVLHFPDRGEVDIEIQKDLTIMPGKSFSGGVNEVLGYPAIHYQHKSAELPNRRPRGNWQKKKEQ